MTEYNPLKIRSDLHDKIKKLSVEKTDDMSMQDVIDAGATLFEAFIDGRIQVIPPPPPERVTVVRSHLRRIHPR